MFFEKISSFLTSRWRSLDKGLLYGIFTLMLFGIFLTLAASPGVAERTRLESFHFIKRQFFFLAPAIATLFLTSLLTFQQIRRLSALILLVSIFSMLYVLLFGMEIKGAQRWIHLLGITIQPSEFAKPAFAVVCAWLLASGRLIKQFPGYLLASGLFILITCLLLGQPDVGMALTIASIFCVQLFLSGIPMALVGILMALFAAFASFAYFFFDHVHARINRFFMAQAGEAYQVRKSLETLQNAGWFGKGPGEGLVKYELPDAHTDFILAVSAEEFGFILTCLLVGLFLFIILRGFFLIRQENNYFSQIAVGGLLTQIAFQAIVNMGSTLNLLPTKGMTLPFISYGGSSLVSIGFAFGVILGLTRSHTLSRGLE
ncbi:MAG: putative lipid II flippase FtsW [Lactobacillales bacterium]|jgi:cell division protein FtsW|nr:putative lipid II flippase FtsW [Lactobacillales bacterium]